MTPVFNTADPATWPEVMTLKHVAELWQRSPKAIQQARYRGTFRLAPMDGIPLRWKKVDVLRHLGRDQRRAS